MHFIGSLETSHPYPQWRVVSPDEVVSFDDSVWYSTRSEKETWLCNHCPNYLAPNEPGSFGRDLRMGSRWEASWHVQTEYVTSYLCFVLRYHLRLLFCCKGTASITQLSTWIYSHTRYLCNSSWEEGTFYVFVVLRLLSLWVCWWDQLYYYGHVT